MLFRSFGGMWRGSFSFCLCPAGEFRVPAFGIASAVRDVDRRLLARTTRFGRRLVLFGLDMLQHREEMLVPGDRRVRDELCGNLGDGVI